MNTLEQIKLPVSVLTKNQFKNFEKEFKDGDTYCRLKVKIRYDDECGNGHNTFAITADLYENGRNVSGGCLHEEIEKHFPELAPLIKWHLCSSDGPMHYVANTLYHSNSYEPRNFWAYIEGNCIKYGTMEELDYLKKKYGSNVEFKVDEKSGKVANFDHARSCAIWPEATEEELKSEIALLSRLPALMEEFKKSMESLGFTY